jgi:hypothetical protein
MIFSNRINYKIINLPRGRSFAKEFHQAPFPHQPEASEQRGKLNIFLSIPVNFKVCIRKTNFHD